ncbi:MAG: helix-turn-helix domain-containing protein [Microscillaceae bacterium]|nr:helix-turn-helix domain-containing protein [Microscillaceae bacterium]MDW8460884.1 helix-turn-helix domain-containing protein [Cytophagales bacterium]
MENIEKFNKNIARTLREKRKELGLSQQQIADKLGITQATYSGWENGQREISLPRYVQLAEILGIDTPFNNSYNPSELPLPKYPTELNLAKLKQELKKEILAELKSEMIAEIARRLLKE